MKRTLFVCTNVSRNIEPVNSGEQGIVPGTLVTYVDHKVGGTFELGIVITEKLIGPRKIGEATVLWIGNRRSS